MARMMFLFMLVRTLQSRFIFHISPSYHNFYFFLPSFSLHSAVLAALLHEEPGRGKAGAGLEALLTWALEQSRK